MTILEPPDPRLARVLFAIDVSIFTVVGGLTSSLPDRRREGGLFPDLLLEVLEILSEVMLLLLEVLLLLLLLLEVLLLLLLLEVLLVLGFFLRELLFVFFRELLILGFSSTFRDGPRH